MWVWMRMWVWVCELTTTSVQRRHPRTNPPFMLTHTTCTHARSANTRRHGATDLYDVKPLYNTADHDVLTVALRRLIKRHEEL
jgi:hypothetical protein